MNRRSSNLLLLLLLFIYTLFYKFIVLNKLLKFNESITACFFLVLLFLSIVLLGYRKIKRDKASNNILKVTIFSLIIYFIVIYCAGLITGFLRSSYSKTFIGIFNNTFFIIISIVCTEIFRYIFISSNKDKINYIRLMTFLLIIFDISMLARMDSFSNIANIFTFISVTVLPCIMKNILCSYLCYSSNYVSSLVYRLVMELYVYFVPIEPDLNDYLKSVSTLVLPFLIFMISSRIYNIKAEENDKRFNNVVKKTDIPFILFIILFTCLVLGIGPLKIVGIESGSMKPNLNIGDAVIINKLYKVENLKENDIIAYKRGDILIVHRIIKVNSDKTYITKGDYNNTSDSKYVNKDDIYGKVILRIPFIAYPSVKLKGR